MLIHSHLPYDPSTSHARIPAGGINLIASIDSVSEAQFTASFFGSTKALHGEVAIPNAETTTHNHSNQQYSITAITTSSGAIAERYAYSAYGEPTILNASGSVLAMSAINNRYSYTGREWDATVGLHHFRARWMSPRTGRFLKRDPIGYDGSEWGLYEYVDSSALDRVDPHGKQAVNCAQLEWNCLSTADSNDSWCKGRGRAICFASCVFLLRKPKFSPNPIKEACVKVVPAIACEEVCFAVYEDACENDLAKEKGCCSSAFAYCQANGSWPNYLWRVWNGCRQ
ncbi:MAG: RHS repeat domain-containing protein [Pirellula sp.]|jgi:RHS repeat-associated protein